MTATGIREALYQFDAMVGESRVPPNSNLAIVVEAARAYADLLDRGVELGTAWETSATGKYPAIMVDRPGRYFVASVEEGESP